MKDLQNDLYYTSKQSILSHKQAQFEASTNIYRNSKKAV